MKSLALTLVLTLQLFFSKAQSTFVSFETTKGNITVMLYDRTPKHREQFLTSLKEGLFANVLFNRVIKSFVNQGGDLDDSIINRNKLHPEVPIKIIAPEIVQELYHKKGALGAGRDDNPEKSSFISQVYFVEGTKQTDDQLDLIEQKKGLKFSPAQRLVYKSIGGIPRLDNDYTVFGEIVEGFIVSESINSVLTNKNDLPLSPITFSVHVLSEKESLRFRGKGAKQ
jgi:cyclophilin family peptidyl-prolyl cis-trans isomerase